jgi:hypothetical protein
MFFQKKEYVTMNRDLSVIVHPSFLPAFPVKLHREGGKKGRMNLIRK